MVVETWNRSPLSVCTLWEKSSFGLQNHLGFSEILADDPKVLVVFNTGRGWIRGLRSRSKDGRRYGELAAASRRSNERTEIFDGSRSVVSYNEIVGYYEEYHAIVLKNRDLFKEWRIINVVTTRRPIYIWTFCHSILTINTFTTP